MYITFHYQMKKQGTGQDMSDALKAGIDDCYEWILLILSPVRAVGQFCPIFVNLALTVKVVAVGCLLN